MLIGSVLFLTSPCTQEVQNKIGRAVQSYTGTDGVLDIYAGDKLAKRFIIIDKISTAVSISTGNATQPYHYGYGILDENQNLAKDPGEKMSILNSVITLPVTFFMKIQINKTREG